MQTKEKKPARKRKWKPIYLVEIYRLARIGMSMTDICKTLKFGRTALFTWQRTYPELQQALDIAKKERSEGQNFSDWIYQRLSPEMKEAWKKIKLLEKDKNGHVQKELLLTDMGIRARQQLFLHAYCTTHFNISFAMKRVNINKKVFDEWMQDEEFVQLVKEIDWHKGNFFEHTLVEMVRQGVPAAVIFANKSYNKDRGYASKQIMDVNVSGGVLHGVLDLSALLPYMSEEIKLGVMEALRKYEDTKGRKEVTATEVLTQQIANLEPAIQ